LRLALASWLLIATTVILVPATITLAWQSGSFEIRASTGQEIVKNLREWTAEEIRIRKDPTAETRREELLSLHKRFQDCFRQHEYILSDLEGNKFNIFLVPKYASFANPAISFRADESGKIRAAKVYSSSARCPEDAEVIADVRESEKDFYPLRHL
jgi:hypothetical protein